MRGFALSVEPWHRFVNSRNIDLMRTLSHPLSTLIFPVFETDSIGNQTCKRHSLWEMNHLRYSRLNYGIKFIIRILLANIPVLE